MKIKRIILTNGIICDFNMFYAQEAERIRVNIYDSYKLIESAVFRYVDEAIKYTLSIRND